MSQENKSGLAAIAKSSRNTQRKSSVDEAPAHDPASGPRTSLDEKPPLEFEGKLYKTSIAFDEGVWNCVQDLAHVLSRRLRMTGRGRVSAAKLVTAAIVSFHEKPLDEQLEIIRRLR